MFEQFIPQRPAAESTFWVTQGLLEGSKLTVGFRAWPDTMQIEQAIGPEDIGLHPDRKSAASEVLSKARQRVTNELAQAHAICGAIKGPSMLSRRRKTIRKNVELTIDALEVLLDDIQHTSPFQVPCKLCPELEEFRGRYLAINEPVSVIKRPPDGAEPVIEKYVISEYEYQRGNTLYYVCVAQEDPEDYFRVCSDYLNEDGFIYLPGNLGDNMLAFWDPSVAKTVLAELSPAADEDEPAPEEGLTQKENVVDFDTAAVDLEASVYTDVVPASKRLPAVAPETM